MEAYFESSETVLDFLTLLKVESVKENSDLFDGTVWQDLTQLDRDLENVNKSPDIADAILSWCDKYPKINDLLNNTNWIKVRCDMDDETKETIPPISPTGELEIVENKYEIQRIIKSKQPTPPPNNPQP